MEGVYKYTDEQGVVHYTDSIAKVPARHRKRARHPTGGHVTIVPSTSIDDLLDRHGLDASRYRRRGKKGKAQVRKHGRVILYTTSWCPACKRARAYLHARDVDFVEKDVERDRAALEEMLRKSGGARGVPVIDVRGTILRGFARGAIERALRR